MTRRKKMAENENNHFGSGVMLGSILGAGAVFFLGTKKGKKLLKVLTEEGLEGVNEIAGLLDSEHKPITKKSIEKKITNTVGNIRELKPIEETVQRLEPAAAEVTKEVGNVAKQVGKSAKRLFKNVPKKLRK